jgi:TolA-binding protein
MAALALNLLHQHNYTDAEPLLRNCLKVREAKQPDEWATFNTRSLLGQALLGQKKYTDAEPLLLSGYQGMKQREKNIPVRAKIRLSEALERLIQLYETTGKKDEGDNWRKELEQAQKKSKKETQP